MWNVAATNGNAFDLGELEAPHDGTTQPDTVPTKLELLIDFTLDSLQYVSVLKEK